jgi:UDP-GlcNAc:undecaprenyl-phosphate GlcNAc-1-phosphate transferase
MDLGHGHRRSVVILWTWTLLLSAFVLYPTLTGRNPTYLPFGIIALFIVLFTVLHPSVRARRREIHDLDLAASGVDGAAGDDVDAETLVEGLPPAGSAD